jgi:hypothetical protein
MHRLAGITTWICVAALPACACAQSIGPGLLLEDSFEARPDAVNTGVPIGTSLTVVDGNQTYATDNQVIEGLDIHGAVVIDAHHVVLRNSIVRGANPSPVCTASEAHNSSVIWVKAGASATIEHVEIAPTVATACLDGAWITATTLKAVNIHGAVDGIKAYDDVTVIDSFVHDLASFASDPNQGGGETHNDAVQTYEANQHIFVLRNSLILTDDNNATYQLTQDGGQIAADIHIERNWLDGGGCTLNFAHKVLDHLTGVYVVGNRFGRGSFYDCPILISTQTVLSENSGNVWDDTGLPIPPPQQHD